MVGGRGVEALADALCSEAQQPVLGKGQVWVLGDDGVCIAALAVQRLGVVGSACSQHLIAAGLAEAVELALPADLQVGVGEMEAVLGVAYCADSLAGGGRGAVAR